MVVKSSEQVAQGRGVGVAAAGLLRPYVAGVLELAEVGDEVSGGEVKHVLQPGEGQGVAVVQRGQRDQDAQPRWHMDQGVQGVRGHDRTAGRRSQTVRTAAYTSSAMAQPRPVRPQAPFGPKNMLPAAMSMIAIARKNSGHFSREAAKPVVAAARAMSGTIGPYTP